MYHLPLRGLRVIVPCGSPGRSGRWTRTPCLTRALSTSLPLRRLLLPPPRGRGLPGDLGAPLGSYRRQAFFAADLSAFSTFFFEECERCCGQLSLHTHSLTPFRNTCKETVDCNTGYSI